MCYIEQSRNVKYKARFEMLVLSIEKFQSEYEIREDQIGNNEV